MPVHDWSKVDAGLFHHFHQAWTARICDALNGGVLPAGYSALIEAKVNGFEPDVTATVGRSPTGPLPEGSVSVLDAPPQTRHVSRPETDAENYARRANRITVRHRKSRVVAVIELVSWGNKDRRAAVDGFVGKMVGFLTRGVNLLVIDLHGPSSHDPDGIYKAIWDEIRDEPFELPPDKPLVLAACVGEPSPFAFVESVGAGDVLPEMPLFLDRVAYVRVPLEATYSDTWAHFPGPLRDDVLLPEDAEGEEPG